MTPSPLSIVHRAPGAACGLARGLAALVALGAALLAAAPAMAQAGDAEDAAAATAEAARRAASDAADDEGLWRERFRPVHWSEYALAGGLGVGTLLVDLYLEPTPEPRWRGGILFDDAVQEALGGDARGTREAADLASDLLWYLGAGYPLLVDPLVVGLVHEDWWAAWQMTAMNLEVTAIVGFLSRLLQRTARRERPLVYGCAEDPDHDVICGAPTENSGFWSGHTAMAAAGAGLTCAHHEAMPIYGSDAAGLSVCLGLSATALATGVLRVSADKHYLSDVLIGGAAGFLIGYGLPAWLHYTGEPEEGAPDVGVTLTPGPAGAPWSLGLAGFF